MASVFVCRISSRNGAAASAVVDFERFKHEVILYGSGIWDNTYKNRMKVGDIIGFINGTDCEETTFYELTTKLDRKFRHENNWNTEAYSKTASHSVKNREVIRLARYAPASVIDWKVLRASLGYSDKWIPRNATRMKKASVSSII
jgi:hypothetical protein